MRAEALKRAEAVDRDHGEERQPVRPARASRFATRMRRRPAGAREAEGGHHRGGPCAAAIYGDVLSRDRTRAMDPALPASATVLERGRALMLLQDAWLRESARSPRDARAGCRTHGRRRDRRSRRADQGRGSGAADRRDQRLHVPRAVDRLRAADLDVDRWPSITRRRTSTWRRRSSRCSVRPRGAERDAGYPDLAASRSRSHLLLAFDYGGAEGFVENGRYYMRQGLTGAIYASDQFRFDEAEPGARRTIMRHWPWTTV